VEATVNFAPESQLITWFVAPNHQIEHHPFPRVCRPYSALAPIVAQVCREHQVRYFSHQTMSAAPRSHFRWLRALAPVGASSLTLPSPFQRP
jgi:linoleoyl-CoA desaturase